MTRDYTQVETKKGSSRPSSCSSHFDFVFICVSVCVTCWLFFWRFVCAAVFPLFDVFAFQIRSRCRIRRERERERERERLRDRVRVVRVGSETHRKTKRQMCVAFCFCFRLDSFFFEKKKNVVSYPSSSRNRAATKWIALTSAPSETEWGRQKIVEKKIRWNDKT